MNNLRQIKQDWQNITLLPIFEVEVINKETKEQDYIIFDIELVKNTFVAKHIALTKKEERSKKIAYKKQVIDSYFSLDSNLQELYEECINAILDSDFYTLPYE